MVDHENRPEGHNAERRNRTALGACVEPLPTLNPNEESRRVSGPVVLWSTVKEWYQNNWVQKQSAAQLTLLSHLSHQSEQVCDGSTVPQQVPSANPHAALLGESRKEYLDRVGSCGLFTTVYEQWMDVCTVVGVSNGYDQGQDGVEPMKLHLPTDSKEENSSRMVPGQQPDIPLVFKMDSRTEFINCAAQYTKEVVHRLTGKERWVQNDGAQEHSAAKFTLPSLSSHQQLVLDSREENSSRMVPEQQPESPLVFKTDSWTEFINCEIQNIKEVVQRLTGKECWVQNDGAQEHSAAKFTLPCLSSHQQLVLDSREENSSRMVPEQQPESPLVFKTDSRTEFINCESRNTKEVVQLLTGKEGSVQNDGPQEHSAAKFTRPSLSSHQQLVLADQKHYQGQLVVSLRATKRRARLSKMAPSYDGPLLVNLQATKKRAKNSRMASMESVVGLGQRNAFLRQPEVVKSIGSSVLEQQGTVYVPFDLGEELTSTSRSSCAACIFFKIKCPPGCMFAPYFPPDQPLKFANFNEAACHATDEEKLHEGVPSHQREDASFIDAAPFPESKLRFHPRYVDALKRIWSDHTGQTVPGGLS